MQGRMCECAARVVDDLGAFQGCISRLRCAQADGVLRSGMRTAAGLGTGRGPPGARRYVPLILTCRGSAGSAAGRRETRIPPAPRCCNQPQGRMAFLKGEGRGVGVGSRPRNPRGHGSIGIHQCASASAHSCEPRNLRAARTSPGTSGGDQPEVPPELPTLPGLQGEHL